MKIFYVKENIFCCLTKFNNSLLAKQVWWLIHQEESLFARVFKAKFYLNCSLFDVPSSTKGSYAWKSIFQARNVVELGIAWRVGDGKSIRIRGDKWLPSNPSKKIISPPASLLLDARVSDLIDEELHC